MNKLEKLAGDFANDYRPGSEWRGNKDAFKAGWRACLAEVLAILDEVGPGAADTMGIPRNLGEETGREGEE